MQVLRGKLRCIHVATPHHHKYALSVRCLLCLLLVAAVVLFSLTSVKVLCANQFIIYHLEDCQNVPPHDRVYGKTYNTNVCTPPEAPRA